MSRRSTILRASLLALILISATGAPAGAAEPIRSTNDLVEAMHHRYDGKWYKTLTFVQKTIHYKPDGTSTSETWYEALACPGKLRIDIDPMSAGNGILFTDDTIYQMKGGKVAVSRPMVHPLLVLGFDVYCASPESTMERLGKLGIDLSQFRDDTWQGRPVYVVGAKAGDEHSPQFWIDREHLYFLRMLSPAGPDGSATSEITFDKYEKAGGGWVAALVDFKVDGKLVTREEYNEIHADVDLPDGLFDPEKWSTITWRH